MASLDRVRFWLSRAVAILGLVGSASLGGRSPAIAITCLLVAAAGWSRTRPLGAAVRQAWRWANIGVSMLCLGVVAFEPMTLDAVAALLCWLLAHRAWVHREPRSDRINLFLSLMVLLLGSVTTPAPMILSLAALWGVLAAPLLALSHLAQHDIGYPLEPGKSMGWRVAGLVPLTVLGGLSLLLMMPVDSSQIPAGLSGAGGAKGSGGALVLSELGQVTEHPGIVARAWLTTSEGQPLSGPQYFPLERLDTYSARTGRWTRQEVPVTSGPATPAETEAALIRQEITLEALGGGQLIALSEAVAMDVPGGVLRDSRGRWWQADGEGRVHYTAWSGPRRPGPTDSTGALIPENLDPRVLSLAREWLSDLPSDASDRTKAMHLESRLRENLSYNRAPNRAEQEQSLSAFLFSTKQGHCTYFATALALMLRAAGIESRLVRGFYGGETSPMDDALRIRRSDAHAWAEAHVDGAWLRLDATPPVGSATQTSLLEAAGEWLATRWWAFMLGLETTELGQEVVALGAWLERRAPELILGLVLLLTTSIGVRLARDWWGRHRRERRRGRVALRHDRARLLVARRGWRIPEYLPPRQAGLWLMSRAGPLAEPLESLVSLHYRVRYGGESDEELEEEAEACLTELRALPRRRRAT